MRLISGCTFHAMKRAGNRNHLTRPTHHDKMIKGVIDKIVGQEGKRDESDRCEIEKSTEEPALARAHNSSKRYYYFNYFSYFALLQFQSFERTFTPWISDWQRAPAVRATPAERIRQSALTHSGTPEAPEDCHSGPDASPNPLRTPPYSPRPNQRSASSFSPSPYPSYLFHHQPPTPTFSFLILVHSLFN